MSQRYIGSSISPTAAPTSSASTTGVWSINDQYQAKNAGNWPVYTPPPTTDPYFQYVSMLLPGNGTNGAQNNTFLDSSTNNFTITRTGNTTQGTFTPYGANWSVFTTSGNTLLSPTNSAFTYAGNFTLECWAFRVGGSPQIFADWSAGTFGVIANGDSGFYVYLGSATPTFTVTDRTMPIGVWTHVALVRSGSTVKLYVNGSASSTTATNSATLGNGTMTIGSNTTTGVYISNFRASTTAVYTTNFTPSTLPLSSTTGTVSLIAQSNRYIDNGPLNLTWTQQGTPSVQRFSPFSPTEPYSAATIGGSAYFDGSGDYLTVPSNAAFAFGTGDFTIEFWAYPTVNARQDWIDFDGGGVRLLLFYSGTNIQFYSGATRINGAAMTLNTWQHIALCCASGVIKLFINGVQSGSSYTSSLNFPAQSLTIGKDNAGSTYVTGYMSNIRIVKGTAVYTSAFTPPTAPVTAITNTQLLVNATNAGIIDNAEIGDLETIGDAKISTTQSKFGGSSIYFDGTGDSLKATSPAYSLGTGDFTIECWIYRVSNNRNDGIYTAGRTPTASGGFGLKVASDNKLAWNTNTSYGSGTATISAGQWYYIACTRKSGTLKFWVNGVLDYTLAGFNQNCTNPFVLLGITDDPINANMYLDDFRITKGYCRYTTDFTPPTVAFPTA